MAYLKRWLYRRRGLCVSENPDTLAMLCGMAIMRRILVDGDASVNSLKSFIRHAPENRRSVSGILSDDSTIKTKISTLLPLFKFFMAKNTETNCAK